MYFPLNWVEREIDCLYNNMHTDVVMRALLGSSDSKSWRAQDEFLAEIKGERIRKMHSHPSRCHNEGKVK